LNASAIASGFRYILHKLWLRGRIHQAFSKGSGYSSMVAQGDTEPFHCQSIFQTAAMRFMLLGQLMDFLCWLRESDHHYYFLYIFTLATMADFFHVFPWVKSE
jgi:hypothetical protein